MADLSVIGPCTRVYVFVYACALTSFFFSGTQHRTPLCSCNHGGILFWAHLSLFRYCSTLFMTSGPRQNYRLVLWLPCHYFTLFHALFTPYYHGNNKISFPPEDLLNTSISRICSCVNEKGDDGKDNFSVPSSRSQSRLVLKALKQAVGNERCVLDCTKKFNMFF